MIDDISKHILIVFDSSDSQMNNNQAYSEFEIMMHTISLQYKMFSGKLPKFNLIGHSRGGIINLMYATEHIYNVNNLISIGTPYNGSVLGNIDPLLNLMAFRNPEQIPLDGGIMNDESNISIRNSWNSNYTADANVNVISYGALTSIDLFREMIDEIENDAKYAATYGSIISDYKDLIKTIINIADAYPTLTSNLLNFTNGIAEVTNMFGVDLFDNVITNIEPSLEGQITTEEASKVIDLVQVIDGEFVIADDLFIDTNSQLGLGFYDNIGYNGFKRYVKIFDDTDYTINRAIPNQPGIPHNLEIYDFEITDSIVESVVLGTNNISELEFSEDCNATIKVNGKRGFKFAPAYSGTRRITANNTIITIYKYTSDATIEKVIEGESTISYNFNYNDSYLIVISYYLLDELTIQFNLNDTVTLGNNEIDLESHEKRIFKVNNINQGYYFILSNDDCISLDNATEYDDNKYYKYIDNGVNKYLTLFNRSNEVVNTSICINTPSTQILDTYTTISDNNIVMSFSNPYNEVVSYKINVSYNSGETLMNVYDENNSLLGNITHFENNSEYNIILSPYQKYYIIYSDINATSKIFINPNQFRWKVDDTLLEKDEIILQRGNTYKINLMIYNEGSYVDSNLILNKIGYDECTFVNNFITFPTDIQPGEDVIISVQDYEGYILSIIICLNESEFQWIVENDDDINIKIKCEFISGEEVDSLDVNIGLALNGTESLFGLQENEILTNSSINVTQYLPNKNAYSEIELLYITLNYNLPYESIYENGVHFSFPSIKIHNYFESGNGTIGSPYLISCERHLNNIRKTKELVRYEETESDYMITKNFAVTKNISVSKNFEPIPILKGQFYGYNNNLIKITINKLMTGSAYNGSGLFSTIWDGTVKYIEVDVVGEVNKTGSYGVRKGAICGYIVSGTIQNCVARGSFITLAYNPEGSIVGGICGDTLRGTIKYCTNYMNIKTYGMAGQIVGFRSSYISIISCNENGSVILK